MPNKEDTIFLFNYVAQFGPLRFKGRMYLVRVLKEYITHDRSSEHAGYKIKARARGTPTTHRRSFPEKQLY